MASVKCPNCDKSLKVNDAVIGKRVRCPGCKEPFVVPGAEEVEVVEEVEEKVTTRPRRRAEEDEERPRRPRRRDEDDEEEDERPRRPRKRRPRDDDDDRDAPSSAPMILAILSCVFSCAPIVGYALGRLAMSKANQEIDRLSGKRYRDARKSLQLARTIGIVGMCLSGVWLIIGLVLMLLDKMAK